MSEPEALRLADELLALYGPTEIDERAAAELRRLHTECNDLARQLNESNERNGRIIAQRKPLTDDEIEQCCFEADSKAADHTQTWKWTELFARAIERAHGIGAES